MREEMSEGVREEVSRGGVEWSPGSPEILEKKSTYTTSYEIFWKKSNIHYLFFHF